MRKFVVSVLAMFIVCTGLMAQTSQGIKYQAVARDDAGQLIANKQVSIRVSILKGDQNGNTEFSETHTVVTNQYGLFGFVIGDGVFGSGDFENLDWGGSQHFIKIEMDPEGGSNFSTVGVSQLLAVPYAKHAETVSNADDADADPSNEIQDLKVVGNTIRLTGNPNPTVVDLTPFVGSDDQQISYDGNTNVIELEDGGSVDLSGLKDDADADPGNEIQKLTQVGNIVSLSQQGGTITVEDDDSNPTNELQTLSQNGNTISLSQGGGSITIYNADPSSTNEIQDLVFNSNYLYLSGNPSATVVDMNQFLDNTDDQALGFDQNTNVLALEDGGAVDLSVLIDDADADTSNELQTISKVGNDITLSHGGGTVTISDDDSDPANELQVLDQNGDIVTLSNGGGSINVADDDHDPMNEMQDLVRQGDSLSITNNPFATVIDLSDYTNTDDQTLAFNGTELSITAGNTVDLASLGDDADADPANEIQNLYLQNDSLLITDNPFANIIDLSGYMDNTDEQTLSLSGADLSITGGNTIDLSSFLDNTDAQTLSISNDTISLSNGGFVKLPTDQVNDADADASNELQSMSLSGNMLSLSNGGGSVDLSSYLDDTDDQTLSLAGTNLSIADGNTIDLSSFLDNTDAQTLSVSGDTLSISGGNNIVIPSSADDLGNHTATQNVILNGNYISNDGDNEGIRVTNNGNVNVTSDFFVGMNATSNSDAYLSGKLFDWDDPTYNLDPDNQSTMSILGVDSTLVVGALSSSTTATLEVKGDAAIGSGDAFYFGDPSVDGTWRIVRSGTDLSFERRESGSWVAKIQMTP